jgi:lipopolysaccharide transport system permease protein
VPLLTNRGGDYIYFLIAGLIPWLGISEGVMRSTTSIVDNAAIVRKLPFRSELLVIVPNASALIFEVIAFVLFLVLATLKGVPPRTLWLLPFAFVLQFAVQVGIGLFLAAAYVFFRDLTQLLGFLLSIVFYLSPILYPVVASFEGLFRWNPMTPLLGLFRSAVLSAALPDAGSIVFLSLFATGALVLGLLFFRRMQPTFVDLI